MATYEYKINDSNTSSGLVNSIYMYFTVENINNRVIANIPSNAIVSSVSVACDYKQGYSSSEGDARIYFTSGTSTAISKSETVGVIHWGDGDVTNSWKTITKDATSFFDSKGKVNISNAVRLYVQGYSSIIRKWYIRNPYIVWTYYIPTHTLTVTAGTGGTVTGGGTYESGSTATIVATPNAGYKFVKWSDGNTSATRTVSVMANASYTAEFAAKTYSISYNGNGSTSGSASSQSTSTFADTTLTANYFKKQYTVTLILNPNYSGVANQTLTSSATFKGWEDHGNITVSEGANKGEAFTWKQFDAPYYANAYGDLYNTFKYNKQSLVNHYANYGRGENRSCTGSPRGVYPDKAVVNTLNGIYADNGVTVRLYAQWSAMPAVTLPTPTRSGYNFLGWYTASSGGTQVGNTYTPTENVTLYAHWEVAKINKIYIGTDKPKSIYIGTNEVKSVYVGTTKVYG